MSVYVGVLSEFLLLINIRSSLDLGMGIQTWIPGIHLNILVPDIPSRYPVRINIRPTLV